MVLPRWVSLFLPESFSKQFPLLFRVRWFTKNIVKLLPAALPGRVALRRRSAEAQVPCPGGLGSGSQCVAACSLPCSWQCPEREAAFCWLSITARKRHSPAFTVFNLRGPDRDGACSMNAWRYLSRPDSLLTASLKYYFAAVLVSGVQVALAELPGQGPATRYPTLRRPCPKILCVGPFSSEAGPALC